MGVVRSGVLGRVGNGASYGRSGGKLVQQRRHLVQRQNLVGDLGLDGGVRHAIEGGAGGILHPHVATGTVDGACSLHSINARTAQNHTGTVPWAVFGHRCQQGVARWGGDLPRRGWYQLQPVGRDGAIVSSRNEIDGVWQQGLQRLCRHNGQHRSAAQHPCHQLGVHAVAHVLCHDIGAVPIRLQLGKQLQHGLNAPRRCHQPDHVQVGLRSNGRELWHGPLRCVAAAGCGHGCASPAPPAWLLQIAMPRLGPAFGRGQSGPARCPAPAVAVLGTAAVR